ncbi:RsbRD N-terminal domain-containing protein [Neomoorella thermoacetica]|uniref:RsbT co-antagonist protein RsbRD N-terminal domain-containing protein n=1 Tax=Moorella thermoacetica (strain ATCC 39073 / JCM 9320) TaxID=264732 RepID=Q2RI26_MOOTA|nr:RsbRD N-terminal domain-containing protein [Moorella thermoacetica]AKX94399.1 hypothetical protein MOTHE_c16060 [Moorella thermoacetica]AKX97035.1 hypothetical protein MOTHA_c16890 [Moorella thermoacetica]APC08812.1 hypothetical protein MTJW_16530 [Moorella thermoacetica]OIQ54510.1 hypothetical protein MORE_14790 [Moorella thermoacetica]OIQ58206.1 hypothetical protein MOCA_06310 [Moorella thermoacetica]
MANKKTAVVNRWFQLLAEEYPPETARFLLREKDQFANPVGHTIQEAVTGLFDILLEGGEAGSASRYLDSLLRIQAVQDFPPSRAIGGILHIKKIIGEELAGEIRAAGIHPEEIRLFASRVDRLALAAFDIYMACREKLYEIRVQEVKNRIARLLQKANLLEKV